MAEAEAEAQGGYTLSFVDSEQPTQDSPASTQTQPGTGGSGTQQAPATGTAPGTTNTADPNVHPGMSPPEQGPDTGGSGNSGASANPNAPGIGTIVTPNTGTSGNTGTVVTPNGANGSPSADPNPEARGADSQLNPGGNGNPGANANPGTGGTGNTGSGGPAVAPAPSAQQGIAVVDAIYTGVVTSVSTKEVVIVDAGTRLPLEVGTGTRILREGQAIKVNQLKEGEKVRAVVNIVGKSHTREIAVLSKAEARRAASMRSR
ncbi:MAG: hypothetical protein EOO71_07325 [Myxococcaceae bacterium]|nr:MAG: hypothetical protein EOO71_07325 [Myxococcaceae bacterium]